MERRSFYREFKWAALSPGGDFLNQVALALHPDFVGTLGPMDQTDWGHR